MSRLYKAALIRAYRTFLQTLLATIPAGATINVGIGIDWRVVGITILNMSLTAFIAGVISFIQSVVGGLPEVMDEAYDEDDLEFVEFTNTLTHGEMETEEVANDE